MNKLTIIITGFVLLMLALMVLTGGEQGYTNAQKEIWLLAGQSNMKSASPTAEFIERRLDVAESVLVVNGAVGGNGFANNKWNRGDVQYNWSVNKVNQVIADNPDYTFKGVIWQQGEADTKTTYDANHYLLRITAMWEGMKQDITMNGNEIFVQGTMVKGWITTNQRIKVDKHQHTFADQNPDVYIVDLPDYGELDIHYDQENLRTNGYVFGDFVNGL